MAGVKLVHNLEPNDRNYGVNLVVVRTVTGEQHRNF